MQRVCALHRFFDRDIPKANDVSELRVLGDQPVDFRPEHLDLGLESGILLRPGCDGLIGRVRLIALHTLASD